MQRNIVETILGAVVLLVAGGFVFFFYRNTDIKPATGYELTAEFSQINGLETGSPVRLAGVKIGQILGFELDRKNYRAIVHMNIDNGVELPTDTTAIIESAGLLDGKFMTMQPGAEEEMLKQGDKITMTQASPSLEQLLGKFIFSVDKAKSGGDEAAPEEKHDTAPAPEEKPTEEKAPEENKDGEKHPDEKAGDGATENHP